MSLSEVRKVLQTVLQGTSGSSGQLQSLALSLCTHRKGVLQATVRPSSDPLILFLDSTMAQLPLEACPCLWEREVVRAVSPGIALQALHRSERSRRRQAPQSGYSVLDPFGNSGFAGEEVRNLVKGWEASCPHGSWKSHIGKPCPSTQEIFSMLGCFDVFLYMGHGEGAKQLLKQDLVQKGARSDTHESGMAANDGRACPLRSAVVLMGCSSAKTFRPVATQPLPDGDRWALGCEGLDEYESFGLPLSVLIGGGPVMVGALWDVLGGDLDMLARALLELWVGKAPGAAPVTSRGVVSALVAARSECLLPYLTGASVVCYGIPL